MSKPDPPAPRPDADAVLREAEQVLQQWITVNGDAHWDRLRMSWRTVLDALAAVEQARADAERERDELHAICCDYLKHTGPLFFQPFGPWFRAALAKM